MRPYLYVIPAGALAVMVMLFFHGLTPAPPSSTGSWLVDKPAPPIQLPPLDQAAHAFGSTDLGAGHVTVVNIWASWCTPCRAEVPALRSLAKLEGVVLDGIVYEDRARNARQFLLKNGNPFNRIDIDTEGRAGRAWGVDGVPETFVIDGKGVVRLRYPGPIVGNVLDQVIRPAIDSARNTH